MSLAGYDRLEHLRHALFWESDTPVIIVSAKPYTAHADDSGKKNTPMLVVGGYVAKSEQWEFFQKTWIPKIEKKGMREFKRSKYDMKKFGREFLLELGDLIYQHTAYGFAYGIYCDDWREVAKEYAMELFHLVPYSICARTCIGVVREWCANNKLPSEYMAYTFDQGSEDAGELVELLKIDQSQEARKVSLTTDDSKRIAGLQSSDFLAYEIRKQYLSNPDPKDWNEMAPELVHLLRGRPFLRQSSGKIPKFGIYRAENLRTLCQNAGVPLIKDVPAEIWSRQKPIRLRFPATKP